MNKYVTGNTIKNLRESQKITQKELASALNVSDKTISKWETGNGLPDITLIEPLASELHISVAELMSGDCIINNNRSFNMQKIKFYVCPICGNIITSTGESLISCCGITLPVLEPEEEDESHNINVEKVEHEYFVSLEHDMSKNHYISFLAYVTIDGVEIKKLYPEGNAEARFLIKGRGFVYAYCNKHGLIKKRL